MPRPSAVNCLLSFQCQRHVAAGTPSRRICVRRDPLAPASDRFPFVVFPVLCIRRTSVLFTKSVSFNLVAMSARCAGARFRFVGFYSIESSTSRELAASLGGPCGVRAVFKYVFCPINKVQRNVDHCICLLLRFRMLIYPSVHSANRPSYFFNRKLPRSDLILS